MKAPQAGAGPARIVAGIEPDPVTRMLIRLYLEPLGYTVRIAANAGEYRPAPVPESVAAFLINLDTETSPAALAAVEGQGPDVPVVGLVADGLNPPAGRVAGRTCHLLTKPVQSGKLLRILDGTAAATSPASAALGPAPAADPPPLLAGFQAMIAEMEMDPAMAADLALSFVKRGQAYLVELEAAAGRRDAEALGRITHAFKGMAANLRLAGVTAACERLRAEVRGSGGAPADLMAGLKAAFAQASAALETYLPGGAG